jgi:hypothetical protein
MAKVLKFWAGLGVVAVSSTLTASAAVLNVKQPSPLLHLAAAAAGEAGESGKTEVTADDQPEFIGDLALIEGHMRVAVALYKKGKLDDALNHVQMPTDELYVSMKAMFEARKTKGFALELQALSKAIKNKSSPANVDALFHKMKTAIVKTRGDGEAVSAHAMTSGVLILLQNAVKDYAAGVINGEVKDAKEYQDAWGLVQAAKAIMADINTQERGEHPEPLAEMDAALSGLDALWPDIAGTKKITADPHMLAVVAAKVELAGLTIK